MLAKCGGAHLIFYCWVFVKDQVYSTHQYVIWQTYKKEFMLVLTVSHHSCFITNGSKFSIGSTFPVTLMEAMLMFIEYKVKKPSLHSL